MSPGPGLRPGAVYAGGMVLFGLLAWLLQVNVVIGLAVTPALFHLLLAVKAVRSARTVGRAPEATLYRVVAVREALAAALFLAGAGYIALRMGGSPRLFWLEILIALTLIGYVTLARLATLGSAERDQGRPPEEGPTP